MCKCQEDIALHCFDWCTPFLNGGVYNLRSLRYTSYVQDTTQPLAPCVFLIMNSSGSSFINRSKPKEDEDEDDDYMNMIIPEPAKSTVKETYTQRRTRKERESEARGHVKSKAERHADETAAREAALAKSLLENETAAGSKGLRMMAKMGFRPGAPLGKTVDGGTTNVDRGRLEPIGINMKEGRGGIGMDTEKKRKFREEVEGEVKRVKAEESDYRARVRREREEVRHEGQFHAAMRVAQRMSEEEEEQNHVTRDADNGVDMLEHKRKSTSGRTLKSINVLWRGLVRSREEKERSRRMRNDLRQSHSRLPGYEDPNEDKDDQIALGRGNATTTFVEDLEDEDEELASFNELPVAQRLQKLVSYLREDHQYCFWCKYAYPDRNFDGCPGLTEEEHD